MQNREEEVDPSSQPEPVPCIPSQRSVTYTCEQVGQKRERRAREAKRDTSVGSRKEQASKQINIL